MLAQCLVHRKSAVNASNKLLERDPGHQILLHEPSLLTCKSMVIIPLFIHATLTMGQILLQLRGNTVINNTDRFFLMDLAHQERDQ